MSSKSEKARERAERAAQAFAEAKKKQRRRNIVSVAGVAVLVLVIIGGGFAINKWRDNKATSDLESGVPQTTDYSLVVGDDDAPHKIVIYEDFLCPICGTLEATAGERLAALAAEGKVQIDYRPIAILSRISSYTDEALNAFFVVREAAGDDVAKKFHDLLYADQPAEDSETFPDADWLVDKAVEAGATEADVRDGIENDAQEDAVSAATSASEDAGVQGTPTVLLDGKVFDEASSMEDLANKLVAAVE